ncbi:hypothetical protein PAXINDRAFT_11630 [Paxillus involutus ATCC 200175]|uniref:Uncharacterized protein n=1 Tax=Paxillus involutus ATCC 200175 TaxID=664439 RepID=A0A0C9U7Y1_PAXIN|nr:hypothetical protein PAXINDRAFT_11630 [Paxillus involutus ATCC 200175]
MAGIRRKSKSQTVAPKAVRKHEPASPTPSNSSRSQSLSEVSLRKLPRIELQKLAREHKVKANLKSDFIIQELLKCQVPKNSRHAEDDPEEGPSKKRVKREDQPIELPPTPESQTALLETQRPRETHIQAPGEAQPPRPPSPPRPASVAREEDRAVDLVFDEGLFSGTESEMTEVTQNGYNTPVSSRSSTPFPAYVYDLERCVTIMQEISAKDQALLDQVAALRETAAKLRKRAGDVRDIVKAQGSRRERMETYFRYWQQMDPDWHRQWLYGEKMVPEYLLRLQDDDAPAGPPTVINAKKANNVQPVCAKPPLAPEQQKVHT